MSGERVANRFGRPFPHRLEKCRREDLKNGDHIVVERYYMYWHHMRVNIDEENEIWLIHYYHGTSSSGSGSEVFPDRFESVINPNDE